MNGHLARSNGRDARSPRLCKPPMATVCPRRRSDGPSRKGTDIVRKSSFPTMPMKWRFAHEGRAPPFRRPRSRARNHPHLNASRACARLYRSYEGRVSPFDATEQLRWPFPQLGQRGRCPSRSAIGNGGFCKAMEETDWGTGILPVPLGFARTPMATAIPSRRGDIKPEGRFQGAKRDWRMSPKPVFNRVRHCLALPLVPFRDLNT